MGMTVGVQFAPQLGDIAKLRDAWMRAEEMGTDILWTCDHFHAQIIDPKSAQGEHTKVPPLGKNFEATTIQAAMAVTTTRPQIGCVVHSNSYRNPNLMADIARTIDHLSGGRYILGLGSGYLQRDYDEYGYEYGTTTSRLNDLARDIPIVKDRLSKLIPPPLRKMPILIASMGDKVGLRIVAQHADMWQVYGPLEKIRQKIDTLRWHCDEVGRPVKDIQFIASYVPDLLPDTDLNEYERLGISHVYAVSQGPEWDLSHFKDLLAWKKSRG